MFPFLFTNVDKSFASQVTDRSMVLTPFGENGRSYLLSSPLLSSPLLSSHLISSYVILSHFIL